MVNHQVLETMLDGPALHAILKTHRVYPWRLAQAIERPESVVSEWLAGTAAVPPYLELTVKAIRASRQPLTDAQMMTEPVDHFLGVPREQNNFWRMTEKFPLQARLAMAEAVAAHAARVPLSKHDLQNLSEIARAGRYYRINGGWRARPVLGKPFKKMRPDTPRKFIRLGFVVEQRDQRGHSYLTVTDLGAARLRGD